jgi:hypothetical protein
MYIGDGCRQALPPSPHQRAGAERKTADGRAESQPCRPPSVLLPAGTLLLGQAEPLAVHFVR